MGSSEDELSELRKKYEVSEKNLRCLTTLAYRASEDYDKLFKMYNENQKQYETLKLRLQDTESKLQQLQTALVPACEEYNQMNKHLQIETACRTQLETHAAKVTRENGKLKRQSQALIEKLGETKCDLKFLETITDESETSETNNNVSASELNVLNEKIASLEEDVRDFQTKLRSCEQQKDAALKNESDLKNKVKKLEAELLKACMKINDHDQMVENFKRSSVLAMGEINNLHEQYNEQILLNRKAEEYAHEMLIQRDAVVRQSSILITNAMSDNQMQMALMEIEKLTKELETMKREHREKVKVYEEQVSSSGDIQKVTSLETELEIASSEVNRLHRAVQELEEWKQTMLEEVKDMRARLEEAEDRLRPPPPPPPPPPPTCPPPFLGPKLLIVKASPSASSALASPGPKTKEVKLADAMSEMMARIKSGNVLSKGATQQTPKVLPKAEPPKAMVELENILKSLSVKRPDDGVDTAIENHRRSKSTTGPPPVFPKTLRPSGIRKVPEARAPEPPSELERKLSLLNQKKEQNLGTNL